MLVNDYEEEIPCFRINLQSELTEPKTKFQNILENVPILIKDVLNLKLDESFGKNLSAFGINFKTITIYGICTPNGNDYLKDKRKYIVDDGTGSITVKYPAKRKYNVILARINEQLELMQKQTKKDDTNQMKLNDSMKRILAKIEEEAKDLNDHIKNGQNVSVVGVPYRIAKNQEVCIHAYEIKLDSKQSRDKEIYFKKNLIKYYTSIYSSNLK